ncbi:MAG TPA: hypothetical protein VLA16_04290 [Ideonella sp.]|nr:hypothetical protein [Ideonella sp.]
METAKLLEVLIGFALGAIGSYLALYWKVRKELEAQYDKELRAERLQQYKLLWTMTEPLAKYSPPGPVSVQRLRDMSSKGRCWYFQQGGIFMSERTRDRYFAFQEALLATIAAGSKDEEPSIKGVDLEPLRKRSSRLRTAMTEDVGTRRASLFARWGPG